MFPLCIFLHSLLHNGNMIFLYCLGTKKKIHNKIMVYVPVTNRSNTYFSAEGSLAMSNGSSIDNLCISSMYISPKGGTYKRNSDTQARV